MAKLVRFLLNQRRVDCIIVELRDGAAHELWREARSRVWGRSDLGSLLEPEVADVAHHCWAMRGQHAALVNRTFRLRSGVCDSDELSFEVVSRKVAMFSS